MTRSLQGMRSRVWSLTVFVLTISGFAQMPIFKRYYIADLPGLGWLANYSFTHKLHYVAAMLLLAMAAFAVTRWLADGRHRMLLSPGGWLRVWLLAGIIGTGALRMYKNQSDAFLSPELVLAVDWAHLGLVIALGLSALVMRRRGRGRYAVRRDRTVVDI